MTDEKSLVQASLTGDSRSFERLVEKYQSTICAITFAATGRLETSEELAQETFFRAWKNLAQLKEFDKFRFWLCGIARHLIQTYYQQKQSDKVSVCDTDTLETLATQNMPSPTETLISREEEMMLSQALMQIPEEYREPLVLYYRQQQSTKEVAESLDLNEATVRTRLSRGRQMLKDQVATMVEQTLAKTGPTKKFTKAVMVSIGAGLAAGTAATAGMAAAGAGVSTATTGILTATAAKVTAIAAAVILTAGVAIYSYNHSQENTPVAQPTQKESIINADPQASVSMAVPAVQKEINPEPLAKQSPVNPVAPEKQTEILPEKTKVRHPDWPGIDEPVKSVYAETQTMNIDGTKEVDKFWARLPDAFRDEGEFNKITIDNGKQRLVLDPDNKQAQIEPSWYKNGKMIYKYQSPIEEHPAVEMAKLFRDPNSNPKYSITKLATESNDLTTVYNVKVNDMNDPNGVHIKIWVDNHTLLPEKLDGIVVGDPNEFGNTQSMAVLFDFAPISDSIFAIDIPAEYKALPVKQTREFRGQVIDLLGNPVADAEVYLDCWELGERGPLMGRSDKDGQFLILLPPNETGFRSTVSLWATLPYDSSFSAWTLLRCPNDIKYNIEPGGPVPGNPGIVYPSDDYSVENTDKGAITHGAWCISASDIILVMEPGIKIFGWIQDIQSNLVSKATIKVLNGYLAERHGHQSGIIFQIPKDIFTIQTNEQGYYEIGGIPKLWKGCGLSIQVSPDASQNLVGESTEIKFNDPNQPIEANFVLLPKGPTVRGIVADNYGTPLPGRTVSVSVNDKYFPGYAANTDKDGRFEFKHCPADKGLEIRATLSSPIYNLNGKETGQEYYPDVTVDVGCQPGQDEYEVKLVAIKPEIEIEAVLTDLAGNPLPYFPVELRTQSGPIPTPWIVDRNLKNRTNENGQIKFVNVPEMEGLRLTCSYVVSFSSDDKQSPEMQQYFKQLKQDYQKYHWTEALVPFDPGQKKYQMIIVIPTEEEYKRQKEREKSQSAAQNQ